MLVIQALRPQFHELSQRRLDPICKPPACNIDHVRGDIQELQHAVGGPIVVTVPTRDWIVAANAAIIATSRASSSPTVSVRRSS